MNITYKMKMVSRQKIEDDLKKEDSLQNQDDKAGKEKWRWVGQWQCLLFRYIARMLLDWQLSYNTEEVTISF